jgi:hypothetical protein
MAKSNNNQKSNNNKFARTIALGVSIITIITFSIALLAVPISGPFCFGDCIEYPYVDDIINQYPHDYFWMFPAILLTLFYLALIITLHHITSSEKRIYSLLAVSLAILSTGILAVNYFVQVSIIQPSLLNGETEGIALFTQYNPHGLFIALEEIGYIIMSISFLAIAPVFSKNNRLGKAIKTTLFLAFGLSALSLIYVIIRYGLKREYIFEVYIITINWLCLIFVGFLLFRFFKTKEVE